LVSYIILLPMNNKPIYHSSVSVIYFDNGDGSLTVVRKNKVKVTRTIATFKNDVQGELAYRNFREKRGIRQGERMYRLFRCPIDGNTYDKCNERRGLSSTIDGKILLYPHIRRGSVRKKYAKVISVLVTMI
jgi:hypothetical protein